MRKYILIWLMIFTGIAGSHAQDNHDTLSVNANNVIGQEGDSALIREHLAPIPDTSLYYKPLLVSADTIANWKQTRDFAYAAYMDSLLVDKQQKDAMNRETTSMAGPGWLDRLLASPETKIFFWGVAILFILFILYRLFLAEGFFARNSKSFKRKEILEEEDEVTGENELTSKISGALQSGNYRLAIRYHYLQTLKDLGALKLIELAADKTNFQYVREITQRKFQNDFSALTLHYEYVWYGEMNIDKTIYIKLAPRFLGFSQKIRSGN